jgi:hypothetical protein
VKVFVSDADADKLIALSFVKKHSIDETCNAVGISRPTLYKYVEAAVNS